VTPGLDSEQPFLVFLVNELINAGFNILSYVEEGNLPRIIRGLQVDFIITDDVQNLHCIFFSKCLVMV